MRRSYNKLWKLMIDKKINKTRLRKDAGISTNAMAKLGKDEAVSIQILEKVCAVLECEISDIIEMISEDECSETAN